MIVDFNTLDYLVSKLANTTGTAEGSNVSPKQSGSSRVPYVNSLTIAAVKSYVGGTVFTLTWLDAQGPGAQTSGLNTGSSTSIAHYNIYILGFINGNAQEMNVVACHQSPAQVIVPADVSIPVQFTVQTVLTNGMVSDIQTSPTVSGVTLIFPQASLYNAAGMTIPNNAYTDVIWDTQLNNVGAMNILNAAAVTVPTNQQGLYLITPNAQFAASNAGTIRGGRLLLTRAGATTVVSTYGLAYLSATQTTFLPIPPIQIQLNQADTIKLQVFQDTGGDLALNGGRNFTFLQMTRIS